MGTRRVIMTAEAGGGAKRDRTADLLHAMQALSQLSYSPKLSRLFYGGGEEGVKVDDVAGLGLFY